MTVFDLFSKRQKRSHGEVPDVYQYETIPTELRVQIVHIIRDSFGDLYDFRGTERGDFRIIHEALCREYGVFSLGKQYESNFQAVVNFFLKTQKTEEVIDVVELTFKYIDHVVREYQYSYENQKLSPDDAIAELNYRFREHGVGYQYESGMMIRVDAQFIHEEILRPALTMLSDPMYEGANAEFLSAHEHYRNKVCV